MLGWEHSVLTVPRIRDLVVNKLGVVWGSEALVLFSLMTGKRAGFLYFVTNFLLPFLFPPFSVVN